MNSTTVKVASLWHCDYALSSDYAYWEIPFDPVMANPYWWQTVTGCRILFILKDMYKFNISYVNQDVESNLTVFDENGTVAYPRNGLMDVNVRPMNCRAELLDHYYPLQPVYMWRFGFLLRREDYVSYYRTFYSKPFTRPTWNCLYSMALIFALVFYILKRWEKHVVGGTDYSLTYEALMVVGGYCQHIPPIDPVMPSRRTAYFIFFIFAYIVYTFYCSNLLSHLVNDKEDGMDLVTLASSQYQCVILDYMRTAFENSFASYNQNYSIMKKKLENMASVTVPIGMEAVRSGKAAILSDYTSLYPFIKKEFENREICKLIQIDLFSNIKKYIFTTNDFPYKEQFKVGLLRVKESGVLKRLVRDDLDMPECAANPIVQAAFIQISTPLIILFSAHVASTLIMVAERIHYKRNRVWPYID